MHEIWIQYDSPLLSWSQSPHYTRFHCTNIYAGLQCHYIQTGTNGICTDECDQLRVSISPVHYTKYILSYNELKDSLFTMKPIKSYWEFGFSMIFKAQKVLDRTIFKRGCCKKKWHSLLNFHLGCKIFPSLTKSIACFEIPNIWQESQFIWLTFTIKTTRQDHVVKIWIAKE